MISILDRTALFIEDGDGATKGRCSGQLTALLRLWTGWLLSVESWQSIDAFGEWSRISRCSRWSGRGWF